MQIEEVEELDSAPAQPKLNVQVSTSFPQAEVFGIKLVNGHATQAVLSINNLEPEPVLVRIVGGSLSDIPSGTTIRNLTSTQYNVEIPAGANQSLTYNFATELHPQDLLLSIGAIIDKGEYAFQIPAFNGTVAVVEAPVSIFDPQMYEGSYPFPTPALTNGVIASSSTFSS
jgi:hypothetical protein